MIEAKRVIVVGAGLAGSEAAWQAAERGARVTLYEMRPVRETPAHKTADFAELVCSNSLRADGLANAVGVLKEEMRRLGSLIMEAAGATAVPAGGALAVDRVGFSRYITERVESHPRITVIREEVLEVPDRADAVTIIASGPLTDGALGASIQAYTGDDAFYFYDAAAPIVTAASVDMTKAYRAARYGKGDADYINCPMEKDEYLAFYKALTSAEVAEVHAFEKEIYFEGCMPVEVLASRGERTLLFGPLKPVGLEHPETGKRPYAVVQLRRDDAAGTLYNMVGFQTHLKWGEQKRVFQLIPGLESAEFVRYGVMHRNSYINSPRLLRPTMQLKEHGNIFFAGQMTGVEGYVESAAAGLMAGLNAARTAQGQEPVVFPRETAHGALAHYITEADGRHFQPMNVNFGILPELEDRIRDKKSKKEKLAQRALQSLDIFKEIL
ncbi:FADH(2)-oxidizing methylenetetrahydrofolate--tRNA-(uracil(54)-C(5))-methyltra nsferase TrmFO [Selenomonas sp. TAMA-11512]|uniref:methylenetetrahydrofolate--tRNA-(uracil(54)- C(5))-methyltransferase (FADH(2)-oxidizing) TrmFO n=1 Tax=Selenomonas sp. TAMA-11512 TaxID=3095337 RepID=UPI00308815DA|nr:FADH(2)-oxidizing methylenetetrahydrofolate--tRNA-(uracil(54)-C(5))-methyltra nsferase TrmFO [Selenomonas sp. TAMA-11512]